MGLYSVTWSDVAQAPPGLWTPEQLCRRAWCQRKPYFEWGGRINFCLGVDSWHDAGLYAHEIVGAR